MRRAPARACHRRIPRRAHRSRLRPERELPQRRVQVQVVRQAVRRRAPRQARAVVVRPASGQLAAPAGTSADRRSPGHRRSCGARSRRRAARGRRRRSVRRCRRPRPPRSATRVSPRSNRGGRAWPYSRAASRSRRSCRRPERFRRTRRRRPRARARSSPSSHRGRRRGAARLRTDAHGRTRTDEGPGHRPARSTPVPRLWAGRARRARSQRFAESRKPPLLPDLRTERP